MLLPWCAAPMAECPKLPLLIHALPHALQLALVTQESRPLHPILCCACTNWQQGMAQGTAEVLKHASLVTYSTSTPCLTHRTTPLSELASRLACRPAHCCQQALQAVCTVNAGTFAGQVALSNLRE